MKMRNALLAAVACAATTGGAANVETSQPLRAEWNVTKHIPREKLIVQSHRGAGELSSENTPEAFELGWKLGTAPEADVRQTTDGIIVAFHDKDFSRVVKDCPPHLRNKGVEDLAWTEVQELNVGDKETTHKVARLEEVFALMSKHPERRLYLDIKKVDLAALAELAQQHGVESQVILAAPAHATILQWKKLVPQSDTLLWMGGSEAEIRAKFNAAREANFEGITQLQVHTRMKAPVENIGRDSVDPFNLSDAFLVSLGEELRARGILYQTLPYGGTREGVYWKLFDLGFMSFATDRPDVTNRAIEKYFEMVAK